MGIDVEKEYLQWFQREFPSHEVEIHYSVTLTKNGKSVPHVMVSVSKEPEGWVHAFSTDRSPATVEQMICSLQGSLTFWKELGASKAITRTPRQLIQWEFEAAADVTNSEFEVCLRSLLEAQLGTSKVTTERVNRYLGMSRSKMYLLLEGIGCSKEKIDRLRKLDV